MPDDTPFGLGCRQTKWLTYRRANVGSYGPPSTPPVELKPSIAAFQGRTATADIRVMPSARILSGHLLVAFYALAFVAGCGSGPGGLSKSATCAAFNDASQ